jgi:hypothetical protein
MLIDSDEMYTSRRNTYPGRHFLLIPSTLRSLYLSRTAIERGVAHREFNRQRAVTFQRHGRKERRRTYSLSSAAISLCLQIPSSAPGTSPKRWSNPNISSSSFRCNSPSLPVAFTLIRCMRSANPFETMFSLACVNESASSSMENHKKDEEPNRKHLPVATNLQEGSSVHARRG